MTQKILIGPSLLAANPLNIEHAINAIQEADIDYLHCDVMDGLYVPNFGLSLNAIEKICDHTSLPLDVHFMTQQMDVPLSWCQNFKPNSVSFHSETVPHVHRCIETLKNKNIQVGLVFNPATSIRILDEIHDMLDFVIVMGVNPGFCGQQFIASTCLKIKRIHEQFPNLLIQVDGAIGTQTIKPCFNSGARSFVCGSSLFSKQYHQNEASLEFEKNKDLLKKQVQALRQAVYQTVEKPTL